LDLICCRHFAPPTVLGEGPVFIFDSHRIWMTSWKRRINRSEYDGSVYGEDLQRLNINIPSIVAALAWYCRCVFLIPSIEMSKEVVRGWRSPLVFGIGVGDVPEGAAPMPGNELELLVEIATPR
jgi:hypothetical protein